MLRPMTAGLQQMRFTLPRCTPEENLPFAQTRDALLQVSDDFVVGSGEKIVESLIGPEFKMQGKLLRHGQFCFPARRT